jgi:hypothetical protein
MEVIESVDEVNKGATEAIDAYHDECISAP